MNLIPPYLLKMSSTLIDSIPVESRKSAGKQCKYYVENYYIPLLDVNKTDTSQVIGIDREKDPFQQCFLSLLVNYFDHQRIYPEIKGISLTDLLLESKKEELNSIIEEMYYCMESKGNELGLIISIDALPIIDGKTLYYFELFVQNIVYQNSDTKITFIFFYDESIRDQIKFSHRNYHLI